MTSDLANELYERGLAAFRAGRNEESRRLNEAALEAARDAHDRDLEGQALAGLCRCALRDRDFSQLELLEKELQRIAETRGAKRWTTVATHMRAEMARMEGDLDRAAALYSESMLASEEAGNVPMVAAEAFNLTLLEVARGRPVHARAHLRRHLDLQRALPHDDPDPYGLIAVAALLALEGAHRRAAVVAAACRRLLRERDVVPDPADEASLAQAERTSRASLARAEWEDALVEGAERTYAGAIRLLDASPDGGRDGEADATAEADADTQGETA